MTKLCVIPGDGIGPEVVPVAVRVLEKLVPGLKTIEAEAGWTCFQRHGTAVPERTLKLLLETGAGLFGAVSSPARKVEGYRSAILTLRQDADLYVNLRPVRSWPQVSPQQDVDLIVLRENSEGLYVGIERMDAGTAIAECHISEAACVRLARKACLVARHRSARRITVVHKANVLPLTGGLFRDTVRTVLRDEGLDPLVDERLVDVAALELVAAPRSVDMLVTSNLFGDILSDLASHWCGGLGMAPSLNWGDRVALAEPVHGSAPDIAGSGRANPIAAILSAALLLRYHWRMPELAGRLDTAVEEVLRELTLANLGTTTTAEIERAVLQRL
ncbi:isocitrate/isopropylmalate dehydrogenase family protein [Halopseudomonas nanhaiensis]|uniref:isocitrate/isopropylmalate dehydrogenase family protein n=1 Tax=Halopseudomonas nanhaiensis TaxID=2830842 RepID=UPI001CC15BFF|nr:isocitrate/isopropylmalate family dehydrogenase [Halopseudomonas nanhaiensis]UAW97933.1 isocitrate/isopropylmalate dehydrogenase family protein [Halopseudomonas nanhaiensis]